MQIINAVAIGFCGFLASNELLKNKGTEFSSSRNRYRHGFSFFAY
jgi:hypothetical protein